MLKCGKEPEVTLEKHLSILFFSKKNHPFVQGVLGFEKKKWMQSSNLHFVLAPGCSITLQSVDGREMAGTDSADCSVEWIVPSSLPMCRVRCYPPPAASNPLPGITKQKDSNFEVSGKDASS